MDCPIHVVLFGLLSVSFMNVYQSVGVLLSLLVLRVGCEV